jgi:UTP--glucose-1-phosphate uridylyltransferase
MMKVSKAIIPAAGLGTRFLPATKAQPKEMLPLIDKPTIQYIVEEAVAAGIKDILIITGRGKRAIEDHFDKSYELEDTLYKKKKFDMLQKIQTISGMANIHYIRQSEPRGLGDAISCASQFIGNEPFAVLLGDDIVKSEKPCIKQLIDVYSKYEVSVIGVQKVPDQDVSKYGIIEPVKSGALSSNMFWAASLVEKPPRELAPSNYAIMGRYILTPQIFKILSDLPAGQDQEVQLTDAIKILNESEPIIAYEFEGTRYDIGNKLGFIKATIDFALDRQDLNTDVRNYLNDVMKKEVISLT